MKDILGQLDELLAVMRDPGILERRAKIRSAEILKQFSACVLGTLEHAAESGATTIGEAAKNARLLIEQSCDAVVKDLEAIDKPLPAEGGGE